MSSEKEQELRKMEKHQAMTIDEAITAVGEYGRFQIILNFLFCFMSFPSVYQIMIMYFAADTPNWRCRNITNQCPYNASVEFKYNAAWRCSELNREDWEYVLPPEYSLVTQLDISCGKEWVLESMVSVFFIGWIIGSVVLGWFSDNYGRKPVVFISTAVILITALLTPLLRSIYLIIFTRLVIGIFIPGTYQQMIIIMTELVGAKYRAFSGNIIFVFVTTSMAICGLKAYFVRDWKMLYIICSAPYLIIPFFYKFVPESIRTLAINDKSDELMATLKRIARFNKRELPIDFLVVTEPSNIKSSIKVMLDLVRPSKFAKKTFCQSLGYVVGGMTFYGLYLAAKDLGGSMYRDYTIITMCEIPFALSAIPLCDHFGRKKTVIFFYIIATLSCVSLALVPETETASLLRVLLGMLGKSCCGAGYNTLQTWTMELYPTYIRGGAMGILQVITRLGAAFAPIVDREFVKLSNNASFIFFASLTFVAFCLLPALKEMKGESMDDTYIEDGANHAPLEEPDSDRGVHEMQRADTIYLENELYNTIYAEDGKQKNIPDILNETGLVNKSFDHAETNYV